MSLLNAIRQGVNHSLAFTFPGTDTKFRIAVLSSVETEQAQLAADAYVRENRIIDPQAHDIELQRQLVYRFLRQNDDPEKQAAESVDEVRKLSIDEIGYFMDQYHGFKQTCDPSLVGLNQDEYDELKETLKKTNLSDFAGNTARLLNLLRMTLASKK